MYELTTAIDINKSHIQNNRGSLFYLFPPTILDSLYTTLPISAPGFHRH